LSYFEEMGVEPRFQSRFDLKTVNFDTNGVATPSSGKNNSIFIHKIFSYQPNTIEQGEASFCIDKEPDLGNGIDSIPNWVFLRIVNTNYRHREQ